MAEADAGCGEEEAAEEAETAEAAEEAREAEETEEAEAASRSSWISPSPSSWCACSSQLRVVRDFGNRSSLAGRGADGCRGMQQICLATTRAS